MTTAFADPFSIETEAVFEDLAQAQAQASSRPELPPDAETDDPDAPYGRRPDGKPYRQSSAARKEQGRLLAEARAAKRAAAGITQAPRAAPPRGATTSSRAAASDPVIDRREAALGLLQLPAMALAAASPLIPSLKYDSLAITLHADTLADAAVAAADKADWLGNLLDRVNDVGPAWMLANAVIPLVLQFAANHRFMVPAGAMGTLTHAEMDEMMGIKPSGDDGSAHDAG